MTLLLSQHVWQFVCLFCFMVCLLVVWFIVSQNDVFMNRTGNYLQFRGFLSNLFDVFLAVLSSRCDPPKIPDSATNPRNTKKKYKYNDRVYLKCKDGFSKVNSGILSCRANGRWSGSISCSRKFSLSDGYTSFTTPCTVVTCPENITKIIQTFKGNLYIRPNQEHRNENYFARFICSK